MPRPETPQDAMRGFLAGEDPNLARFRRVMRRLPHGPNCKLCAAPFEGPAGAVLRHVGFARFPGNPNICGSCIKDLNKVGVFGAEIPVSLMFADIRGSTGIGERSSPSEFRAFLDRFYQLSSRAILDNDGIVDKFVGDEAIGLFFAGISGAKHAAAAIRAARGTARCSWTRRRDPKWAYPRRRGGTYRRRFRWLNGSRGNGDRLHCPRRRCEHHRSSCERGGRRRTARFHRGREAAGDLDSSAFEHRTLNVRGRSDAVEVVALRSASRQA